MRSVLRALHTEQWRSLPPLRAGASTLALSLSHPVAYATPPLAATAANPLPDAPNGATLGPDAASRRSPLALLLHVLHAATMALPAGAMSRLYPMICLICF